MEKQIAAMSDQIAQERASNMAALEEQRRCMKADNDRSLRDVESGAAAAVQEIQQRAVKLQGELGDKNTEVSALQNEYDPHKMFQYRSSTNW